ncbi:MAG: hypothetical protein BroJett025_00140 [Patescibacteria group bacterium]|nr:MAG: hypothetical protein BroJett025_00140 [Patescibacteria group bacterium]
MQTYNLLAIVILGLVLELIIAYKLRADKKRIEKMDEDYKKEFEHIKQQLDRVVSATRSESQEIISKTLDQYHDVHSEVQNFTLKLHQRIDDITDEIVEQQKTLLQDHAKKSSEDLIKATEVEIKNLGTLLQKTVVELQQKVSNVLVIESQSAQREIESFKKDQIEKIAKESEQLVNKVAKRYLGKVLHTLDKHELTLELINELWQEETAKNGQK